MKKVTKLNYRGNRGECIEEEWARICIDREALEGERGEFYKGILEDCGGYLTPEDFADAEEDQVTAAYVYYITVRMEGCSALELRYYQVQVELDDGRDVYTTDAVYNLTESGCEKVRELPAEVQECIPDYVPYGLLGFYTAEGVIEWGED